MSSQLTSLVLVFDGSNWSTWSKVMIAFFMSQGLWGYVAGTIPAPVVGLRPPPITAADVALWNKNDEMARGNLTLRLSPAVQQAITGTTSQILWDAIKDRYGVVSMPCIYKDFKEAISIRFNPNQHPTPQFEKMAATFARLGAVTVGTGANQTTLAITPQLQALIALSALPAKWENLIPIICAGVAIADLKLDDVASQVIGQFETETNRRQHKAAQSAQKISAVKRKHGDPRFTKQGNQQQCQQQSSTSGPSNQQQPHRQHSGRGSGKGKGKGKQRDGAPQHSHIASVAALAPPTTHKVLHIGLSGSSVRTESEASPIEKSSSFYPSVKKARTLAERMDVPATIQTVKTLEERFADIDAQMRPRIDAFMDEEYDSDFDVDMSQPSKGALPIIDFKALNSESINALGLQFGELTTDGGSDKENRAPTPSYVTLSKKEKSASSQVVVRL